MKNILYTIILSLISTNLLADATQGEMFGFKIGDIYTVKESDTVYEHPSMNAVWVSDAKKPKDYGKVYIWLTKLSNTILRISSHTCFKNKTARRSFQLKQVSNLKEKYSNSSNIDFFIQFDMNNRHEDIDYGDVAKKKYSITIINEKLMQQPCVQIGISPHYNNKLDEELKIKKEEESRSVLIEDPDMEGL